MNAIGISKSCVPRGKERFISLMLQRYFFPIAGKDIYLNFIIIIISLRIKVFIRGSLIIVVRIYFISFFFSFLSFFSFYVIRKWITFFFFFNFEVETKSGLHFLLLLFNFFIHCLICILSVWRDCTQRKE